MNGAAASSNEIKHEPAKPAPRQRQQPTTWWRVPSLVKRVFDKFPFVEYDANPLPQGVTSASEKPALYVFARKENAASGGLSYNPGCLKWQTYLRFQKIDFVIVPSNNHASPTGALPFLLAPRSSSSSTAPVPSTRLQRWCSENSQEKKKEPDGRDVDLRYEAYMSLLDHRVRNAYLYTLYLSPPNFAAVAQPLYVDSSTSIPLVRAALSHHLKDAARSELLKQAPIIDVEALYREAQSAFSALSELLGGDTYFFDAETAGLFDAAVFAYTHILLDQKMQWQERRLSEDLAKWKNLVRHRDRILQEYFPSDS